MQRTKAVAVAFYLGAVVVGVVLGVAADRLVVREWLAQRARDQRAMQNRFASELSLTPEQQAVSDSIFAAARRADSLNFAPLRPQVEMWRHQRDSIFREAQAQFRSRLTPDQQQAYDKRRQRRGRGNDGRR